MDTIASRTSAGTIKSRTSQGNRNVIVNNRQSLIKTNKSQIKLTDEIEFYRSRKTTNVESDDTRARTQSSIEKSSVSIPKIKAASIA